MTDQWSLQFSSGHLLGVKDDVRLLIDSGMPISFGYGGAIQIDGKTFTIPESATGFSIESIAELVGFDFNLFLGMDILSHCRVLVDVPNGQLIFGSEETLRGSTTVPIERRGAVPCLDVTSNGRKYRAIFDTGAATSYVPLALVRNLGPGRIIEDFYPGYGRFKVETWTIAIDVQDRTFQVVAGVLPSALHALTSKLGIDVILGSETLFCCRTILDFVANRIEFDKSHTAGGSLGGDTNLIATRPGQLGHPVASQRSVPGLTDQDPSRLNAASRRAIRVT